MRQFIVRDGDTMWKISQDTGIRLSMLMAANPQVQNPNVLTPGTVLSIPEVSSPTPMVNEKKNVKGIGPDFGKPISQGVVPKDLGGGPFFGFVWPHVVQQGETWADIARQYKVTVARLQQTNRDLLPGPLEAGMIVYVPAGQHTDSSVQDMAGPIQSIKPPSMGVTQKPGPGGDLPYGPHEHQPYRTSKKAQNQPYPFGPISPFVMPVQSMGMLPYGYGHVVPPYTPPIPYQWIPSSWYFDMGESSSWDSWSSSFGHSQSPLMDPGKAKGNLHRDV